MKRLLYSEFATDDLKGILDYIAGDKPIAARAFVDAVIETCHAIANNLGIGMGYTVQHQSRKFFRRRMIL